MSKEFHDPNLRPWIAYRLLINCVLVNLRLNILTFSAPMFFRYLKSSAESDCVNPSSPICPKTKDSQRIKSKSAARATESASLLPQDKIWAPMVLSGKFRRISAPTFVIIAVVSGPLLLG